MENKILSETNIMDDSEIGRYYMFIVPNASNDAKFSFSSTLQNVPFHSKHDCVLKNKTKVLILSEPTEVWHPIVGKMLVSKIQAHQIMWVATNSLVPIDEK